MPHMAAMAGFAHETRFANGAGIKRRRGHHVQDHFVGVVDGVGVELHVHDGLAAQLLGLGVEVRVGSGCVQGLAVVGGEGGACFGAEAVHGGGA